MISDSFVFVNCLVGDSFKLASPTPTSPTNEIYMPDTNIKENTMMPKLMQERNN